MKPSELLGIPYSFAAGPREEVDLSRPPAEANCQLLMQLAAGILLGLKELPPQAFLSEEGYLGLFGPTQEIDRISKLEPGTIVYAWNRHKLVGGDRWLQLVHQMMHLGETESDFVRKNFGETTNDLPPRVRLFLHTSNGGISYSRLTSEQELQSYLFLRARTLDH